MKQLKFLWLALVALLLAACGGGGGSPGVNPNDPVVAFFTTAPDTFTLPVGGSKRYLMGGGTAPYFASSSDESIVMAGVSGGVLTVGGVAEGSATVTLRDALGASKTLTVTVSNGPKIALYTTAPSTVTLLKSQVIVYEVGGGTGPYSVTSNYPAVLSATLSGKLMTVTGLNLGSAEVTVRDAVGATVKSTFTVADVATDPLVSLPSSGTGKEGDVLNFSLAGGTPGYSVLVSNPAIASASISGSLLTATLIKAGTTTLVITDAKGKAITVNLTVTAPSSNLAVAPAAFAVSESSRDTVTLSVTGGKAPYRAVTDNLPLSSVTVSGTSVYVALGGQGDRCVAANVDVLITVIDSAGASATSTMTVTDNNGGAGCAVAGGGLSTSAGSSINLLGAGAFQTFSIFGGSAPYSVSSANTAIATASVGGTNLTITGFAAGSTTVTVRDNAGSVVPINVNVVNPVAISGSGSTSIKVGATQTFTVSSGATPYIVGGNTDPGVASATISGATLTVTGLTAGTSIVTVTDNVGSRAQLVVTVTP